MARRARKEWWLSKISVLSFPDSRCVLFVLSSFETFFENLLQRKYLYDPLCYAVLIQGFAWWTLPGSARHQIVYTLDRLGFPSKNVMSSCWWLASWVGGRSNLCYNSICLTCLSLNQATLEKRRTPKTKWLWNWLRILSDNTFWWQDFYESGVRLAKWRTQIEALFALLRTLQHSDVISVEWSFRCLPVQPGNANGCQRVGKHRLPCAGSSHLSGPRNEIPIQQPW